MSVESPAGFPVDHGWSTLDQLRRGQHDHSDLTRFPRSDGCSVARCSEPAVAAVERRSSGSRPAFWQLYCALHCRARGVERTDAGLRWAAAGDRDPGTTT